MMIILEYTLPGLVSKPSFGPRMSPNISDLDSPEKLKKFEENELHHYRMVIDNNLLVKSPGVHTVEKII